MPALVRIFFNLPPVCHLVIQVFTYTAKLAICNVQSALSQFHQLIHVQLASIRVSLAQMPQIVLPVLLATSSKDRSVFLLAVVHIFSRTARVASVKLVRILVSLAFIRTH